MISKLLIMCIKKQYDSKINESTGNNGVLTYT